MSRKKLTKTVMMISNRNQNVCFHGLSNNISVLKGLITDALGGRRQSLQLLQFEKIVRICRLKSIPRAVRLSMFIVSVIVIIPWCGDLTCTGHQHTKTHLLLFIYLFNKVSYLVFIAPTPSMCSPGHFCHNMAQPRTTRGQTDFLTKS